jgi:ABC-type transport system involved in Fe-S cluster assembly fused permease/ATPase subunit
VNRLSDQTRPDASETRRTSNGAGTLLQAVQLFWIAADSYAKRRLALALAVVAVGALLSALTPIALKEVVDSLGASQPVAHFGMPAALVLLYVVGQYLVRCLSELRVMLHGHAEQRLRRQVGRCLFEHVVRMPVRFHLERKVGAMGETIEQGLRGYALLLTHIVYTLVPVLVEFAAVAAILVYHQQGRYLTILAVASIAYLIAFHRWATRIYQPSAHVSQSHIEAHSVLTDSLVNHETVKYFDAESIVCRRYDNALRRTESAWARFFNEYAINAVIVATIFGLSLGASLAFGLRDVVRGVMTVGDLVLINAYAIRLVQPLEQIGFAARDITQGLAFLGQMLALLREKPEGDDNATAASAAHGTGGELVFEDVTFSYREGRTTLKGVSFTVTAGKLVAIVGVSGSGKSSLIRLLFRLYEPDNGRILLDGVPISGMTLSSVRQAIAIIPQDTVLFHDTVANNIGFGRSGATQAEIEKAARLANLHDLIIGLPAGYETVVGERGMKLSGGERQRLAIARAALKRPRIFVCDEATSSLDTKSEREILHNLFDLSRHCSTLVIAHRLSTIVHADEIVVLDRGAVVERGSHDELRALGGHYAALWDAQQNAGRGDATVSTPGAIADAN